MAVDIGPKIGIDGESEFRKQLSTINQSLKTLGSEMKVVTSEFANNAKSEEALTAKNKVLAQTTDALKQKLEMQNKALQESAQKYGENDSRTLKWQQAVNETTAALNNAENEISQNAAALDDLGNEMDETEKKSSKLGAGLKVAGAALAAMAASAAAAAGALAKNVIQSYGELEQNLGGSEAVFGQYAETIQKEGEEAYKNLGVSQSEYLATANKVGALFQGSGVEQQRSLELTTQAMQRAADMASVMGIDTQAALDAITGAAKGNYNMMDNLGVAMNATTLEAYAMDKGFEKAFSQMSNAEKAEVAMQYFFENTSQYAGNFARESTQTVSGAFGLLEASAKSLIAGLGNAQADIGKLAGNVIDALSSVVKNVMPVVQNLARALPQALSGLTEAIMPLLPELINVGMELFNAVFSGIVQMLPQLSTAAIMIIGQLSQGILANLPALIEGAVAIVTTLLTGIAALLPELVPVAVEAVLTIVNSLIQNVDMLINAAIQIMIALADGLINSLPTLIEKAPVLLNSLVEAIVNNLPLLLTAAIQIIVKIAEGIVQNLPKIVAAAGQIIASLVSGIGNLMSNVLDIGRRIVQGVWEGISNMVSWFTSKVRGFFSGIVNSVKSALGIRSPSRVFAGIGKNMALGLGVGFEDEIGGIQDDIDRSVAGLVPSANSTVSVSASNGSWSSAGSTGSAAALAAAIKSALNGASVIMDGRKVGSLVTNSINNTTRARGAAVLL